MWSKSNSLVLVYVAIVAVLVGIFISAGKQDAAFAGMGLPTDLADVILFTVIACLGGIVIILGANQAPIMIMGSLGSLLALTFYQEPLTQYLTLAAMLFSVGLYGMVTSRNAVRVLMSIELMLNAVNINLVAFSRFVDSGTIKGQIFAIFILTVAAAEAAVGLAIVLAIYRNSATVNMEKFNLLKW